MLLDALLSALVEQPIQTREKQIRVVEGSGRSIALAGRGSIVIDRVA